MKYGIREICEVVLRAKSPMKLGTKQFYKGEPVLYFDTLKTSSLEGASTTVYAQGGRGNARLLAWDGEKTTTFTMEDALISPEGLMILAGADLFDASDVKKMSKGVIRHMSQQIAATDVKVANGEATITFEDHVPYVAEANTQDSIYVMLMKEGQIISEPYIGTYENGTIVVKDITEGRFANYKVVDPAVEGEFDAVLVDFYVQTQEKGAMQIEITADSFGSNFYLEASTLFRNELGQDIPAEFVIPNCKVQSNFNFSMAASGDPSTFTFTIDCFPDYTRWDTTHKVLAAIQLIPDVADDDKVRTKTNASGAEDVKEIVATVKAGETAVAGAKVYTVDNKIYTTDAEGKATLFVSDDKADVILVSVPKGYKLPGDPSLTPSEGAVEFTVTKAEAEDEAAG